MQTVFGNHSDDIGKYLGKWYVEHTGHTLGPPYVAIGYVIDNKIGGVAVFENYTKGSIEIHLYAPKCLTRQSLVYTLDYVFNQLNCNVLIGKPRSSNKKMLKILAKMKAKYLTVIRGYYGHEKGDNAVLYILDRDWASKWIKLKNECSQNSQRSKSADDNYAANAG